MLLALALVALAGCDKPESAPESVRPVQLAQVTLGAMAETAGFAGEVKPRHETDLAFRIGGKIVARNADIGARVKKGQVLARLDPADVALQSEAAKAAAAAAEAEYTYAKAEFERYQSLFAQKFVSGSALDQKQNAFNANRAKFDQAKAQLAVAQNQSAYAVLQAPEDGVITVGQRRGGAGRRGGLARDEARARGRARGRDQRAGEPDRRARAGEGDRGRAGGESAEDLPGARARDLAFGRPRDPNLRGARGGPGARCRIAMGNDGDGRSHAVPVRRMRRCSRSPRSIARTTSRRSGSTIRRRARSRCGP